VQEELLRSRFQETWKARKAADWHTLYGLTDPEDRATVTESMFAESEALFEYLSHRVQWVQVIGGQGKIYVTYHHKLTDPSLEKLPTAEVTIHERWIRRGNEWYRDLKWQK
jgi:hypothetical protein